MTVILSTVDDEGTKKELRKECLNSGCKLITLLNARRDAFQKKDTGNWARTSGALKARATSDTKRATSATATRRTRVHYRSRCGKTKRK